MKKVIFVIPSLGGGGAERVFLQILKHVDRRRFRPLLVLFEMKGEFLTEVPSDIDIRTLNDEKKSYELYGTVAFKLSRKLSALIKREQPDVIVSFLWYSNLVALLAKFWSRVRCRLVVSERSTVAVSNQGWRAALLRNLTVRFVYPAADVIIVNSETMGIQMREMFNIPERKIALIHNPVDIQRIERLSKEATNHPWHEDSFPIIVAAGRLSKEKGYSYLIKAVHRLNAEALPCRLIILGEGSERENLKRLAQDLSIDDKVDLPGFRQNPYTYLSKATVFVLSSLFEGFPNVLLEAMALGIPSVATRCPTGPDELITDGVSGILAPPADEKALAKAIRKLLLNEGLRRSMGAAARVRAEDFRIENIIDQYEAVITH